MIERFDYFVYDDYGDVWNAEALPTWKQATEFRSAISKQLNNPRTLFICSVPRPIQIKPPQDKSRWWRNSSRRSEFVSSQQSLGDF